jgi:hypothetical protein
MARCPTTSRRARASLSSPPFPAPGGSATPLAIWRRGLRPAISPARLRRRVAASPLCQA